MSQFYRQPAIRSGIWRALLFFAVWFIVISIFEIFGFRLMQSIFPNAKSIWFDVAGRTSWLVLSVLIIYIFRRFIDRRPVFSKWFAISSRKTDLMSGFLLGAALISLGAFILSKLNLISISPGDVTGPEFWQFIVFFFVVSVLEELVVRGYILTNLLESMHPFWALILSSLLFMSLHLGNPNIEFIPILNLFLAGILLGASFVYTKNLWFPIGLHWSWNLFQGPVFGFEVSGVETKSLFQQDIIQDNYLTGGAFGFEGSILATIFIVASTIAIFIVFKQFAKNENS